MAGSRREPHRAFIDAQPCLGRNATAIYQDLVDLYCFDGAYNPVKRFIVQLRHKAPAQFDRLSFAAGEEMQVDCGEDTPTGCVRIGHSSYAARSAAIGTRVLVRVFERRIEVRDLWTQALLRAHTRVERLGTVVLPMAERVFYPSRATRFILRQVRAIEGRVGQRKLWSIVNLARRYPHRFIDAACVSATSKR